MSMKMVNVKKLVSVMAVSTAVLLGAEAANGSNSTSATANASTTWHKWSPKAMRGNWKYKIKSNAQSGTWGVMSVWSNRAIIDYQGDPAEYVKTKSYKSLGNGKYVVKVSEYAGGEVQNGTMKVQMHRGNKKLTLKNEGGTKGTWSKTSNVNYKYSDWDWKK